MSVSVHRLDPLHEVPQSPGDPEQDDRDDEHDQFVEDFCGAAHSIFASRFRLDSVGQLLAALRDSVAYLVDGLRIIPFKSDSFHQGQQLSEHSFFPPGSPR